MQLLKESPATHDIPVLFYSLITDQDSGYVLEVDYLTKPIGKEELVSALQKYGLSSINTNHGFKVLIIDDEPGILDLHTQIVASEFDNCQILTATNGILGLMLMRQNQPDLVLLDLMMPELDGFGVLNAMQDEQLLRNIPVIILSGQSLNKNEMNRLSKSVAAVMGKGLFSKEEMLDRIDAVISHRKRLGSEPQRLVQRAMAYIHENYTSNISRSDVADHLCVNEQYLSRCFKNEIGIGPITYLSRYRIDQAKQLLEQGDLSITQVAMEIGLSSQSYFSRLFQQETGITPSAYRRGERLEQN
jgi:YesN/AraC family two-component response regulator